MKRSLLLPLSICAILGSSWQEERQPCKHREKTSECLPNGKGYMTSKCNKTSEFFEWHSNVTCPTHKSKCFCYNGWETTCTCVNSRERPEGFPSTGIIRWNGTMIYKDEENSPMNEPIYLHYVIPGELHKDGEGRYLRKMTDVLHWHWPGIPPLELVQFEIIVPKGDGKTFMKYTGDDRSRNCKKTEINEGKSLSWDTIWPQHPPDYHLINETQNKDGSISQWWFQKDSEEYEEERWTVVVKYDEKNDHVIPVSHSYRGKWYITSEELGYVYEPIKEGKRSFKVEDYCDSFDRKY